jgi:glycosyltransferase involved in cell wall biosynthesis
LQLVTTTDRRGAETAAVALDARLRAAGHAVETLALWPGEGDALLDLETLGRRRRDPGALVTLARRLRRERRTVVVGHGSSTLAFGVIASSLAGTPFVYRNIGDPAYWAGQGARRARVRALVRRARRVVALWPGAADALATLHGVRRERLVIIPAGVDTSGFAPIAPAARPATRAELGVAIGADVATDPPLVAYVGALSAEKDPLAAIDAVVQLDGVSLVLAGGGPLRAEAEARAAAVGHGRVVVAGPLADPTAVWRAADALVLPSRTEGIPAAAIEAGLAGLPVVATDVGGVSDVVVDGQTGVLVDTAEPAALAAGLRIALADGPALGAAARERCRARFDLDAVVPKWSALLDEVGATVRG